MLFRSQETYDDAAAVDGVDESEATGEDPDVDKVTPDADPDATDDATEGAGDEDAPEP